jgi:hypothetical protein
VSMSTPPLQQLLRRLAVLAGLLVPFSVLVPTATAGAAPTWAAASTATVHPGVQLITSGAQCTANFIYTDGSNTYIGQAAHCSSTGGNTATNGCTTQSLPIGTPVTITGASKPGTLVYNSWITMQGLHETDANTCAFNDLALVQVDPADVASVNPSIPHWGGPVGLDTSGTTNLENVYSYGNSELRLGVTQLSPKLGVSEGDTGGGWSHTVFTVTPGIPGDSGSAFLDANGNALGILSTLDVGVPGGVTNGVGDLGRELAYLHAHSSFGAVQLATGTQRFNGSQLPLG